MSGLIGRGTPGHVARRSRSDRLWRHQTRERRRSSAKSRAGAEQLYAIQSAPNAKSSGGRRSDIAALRASAAAFRASRWSVEMNIAVLSGRRKTSALKDNPDTALASDEFWERVSGIADFRARLINTTAILSGRITARAASEVARIGQRHTASSVTRAATSTSRNSRTRHRGPAGKSSS